ncbi:MAG TPA: hypothetical protein VMN03_01575, partial [Burkholderiales bacterium]|nr:hypothetical protein [Burkholderiales bacterium]
MKDDARSAGSHQPSVITWLLVAFPATHLGLLRAQGGHLRLEAANAIQERYHQSELVRLEIEAH